MISVDPTSSTPVFEQIKHEVIAQIAAGALKAGDRLPTVRGLAEKLGLANNTVAKAYRELEAAGVIDTRGRSGTFVSGVSVESQLRAAAASYAARARALGVSEEEAVAAVRHALS